MSNTLGYPGKIDYVVTTARNVKGAPPSMCPDKEGKHIFSHPHSSDFCDHFSRKQRVTQLIFLCLGWQKLKTVSGEISQFAITLLLLLIDSKQLKAGGWSFLLLYFYF